MFACCNWNGPFAQSTINGNWRKAKPIWNHNCHEHGSSPKVFPMHSRLDRADWACVGHDGAILATATWSGAKSRSAGNNRRGTDNVSCPEYGRASAHQVQWDA